MCLCIIFNLHFEDVCDETSERSAAQERRDEETAGHRDAVRPTRQQEVQQEEDGQSHRAEGACSIKQRIYWYMKNQLISLWNKKT